jgi:hypothetical protein
MKKVKWIIILYAIYHPHHTHTHTDPGIQILLKGTSRNEAFRTQGIYKIYYAESNKFLLHRKQKQELA